MKRVHYTDSYLLNPQHPVTVNLIGGGGTGSQVLTNLAWKSAARVTPEAQVPLTPESIFRMTPIKS